MSLAAWNKVIQDNQGNVVAQASVSVVDELTGLPAVLFSDRAGTVSAGNPVLSNSSGLVLFFVAGGVYRITASKAGFSQTFRYVSISSELGESLFTQSDARVVRGSLGVNPIPVTSVSDPNKTGASGARVPTMQEDWYTTNNAIWIRSADMSIHPAQVQISGTWVNGDIAKVRFLIGGVNYDFTHNVTGADTNTTIATGLRNAMLANSTFIALPAYPQALNTTTNKWDIPFTYPSNPIVVSNLSTTAAGVVTLTQSLNLLDGPVGFHVQRLSTGRAPVAEDNLGGLLVWGPFGAGDNGMVYCRMDHFIADPATVSVTGRTQWLTADPTLLDAMNRMILRRGLYLTTSAGASPSGGTAGDMGSGTVNTPADAGYYVNGNGFFRYSAASDVVQLISVGSRILQLGSNSLSRLNLAADGLSFYPETDGVLDLGQAATRKFGSVFLKSAAVINFGNGNVVITHSTALVTITGGGLVLAAGTTTLAPLAFVSGTNLTTAAAGAMEYDGVQGYFTINTTEGRGALAVEQYFKLAADGGTISTIANFFGTTSNISLVTNGFYWIEIVLYFLKSTAGTVTWTLTNSAAPTSQNIHFEMSPAATGIVAPPGTATLLVGHFIKDTTAARTVVTASLNDNTSHYARFRIELANATGTNLKIQATTSAGTITPRRESYWRCRRLAAGNVGTFAA